MSELAVTVKRIGETQKITETFKKRDLVIETKDDKYPQILSFQAVKDMCEKLDELRIGDDITIYYNLRGKEYTDKDGKISVFNTLQIWKFDVNQTIATPTEDLPY